MKKHYFLIFKQFKVVGETIIPCFNFEIKMRLPVTTLGIPLFKFIVFNTGYFYSNLFSSTIFMLN